MTGMVQYKNYTQHSQYNITAWWLRQITDDICADEYTSDQYYCLTKLNLNTRKKVIATSLINQKQKQNKIKMIHLQKLKMC